MNSNNKALVDPLDKKTLTMEMIALDIEEVIEEGDMPELTEEQIYRVAEDMYRNPAFWEQVRIVAQTTIECLGWD